MLPNGSQSHTNMRSLYPSVLLLWIYLLTCSHGRHDRDGPYGFQDRRPSRVPGHSDPPLICHDRQWMFNASHLQECRPCTICPEGTGLRKPCGQHHDATCSLCTENTFSLMLNGQRKCVPCTKCENRRLERECIIFEDAICGGCNQGYFYDNFYDACRPCSRCPEGYSGFDMPDCIDQPEGFRCQPLFDLSVSPADGQPGEPPRSHPVETPRPRALGKWNIVFVCVTTLCLIICVVFSVLNFYQTMRMRKQIRKLVNPAIYRPSRHSRDSLAALAETRSMLHDSGIIEYN